MLPFAEESVDLAIAQCRLAEAVWAVAGWRAQHVLTPELQRLGSAICALAGNDRQLAAIAQPELLDCRSDEAVAAYLNAGTARSQDYLSIAAVLAWSQVAPESVYRLLREAHERAHAEGRVHIAVAAQERLAHHALLFGDVAVARNAIERATSLASDHRLSGWRIRCSAAAANLAFDAGDTDGAARILSGVRAESPPPEVLAVFAPAGASQAAADGDDDALSPWSSPEVLRVALDGDSLDAAAAATVALLVGASAPLDPPLVLALRRSLLWAGGVANAAALFTAAARCGDLDQAAYAVDALRALPAPDRPYLRSHYLLARAHLLFRRAEDPSWIDDAGDAARAFNAMGLRRWTNEAMLLLVRQEGEADRKRRRRPSASALTGREQQVAQLIRRGARNREVALALQISEHTVERHVSSILGRLGLRSRWQIAEPQKSDQH